MATTREPVDWLAKDRQLPVPLVQSLGSRVPRPQPGELSGRALKYRQLRIAKPRLLYEAAVCR